MPLNWDALTIRREKHQHHLGLTQSWGAWIRAFPWHHWVTLTFADPASREYAWSAFEAFIRRLERKGSGVWWCAVQEERWEGRHVHLHALLGGTDQLRTDEIAAAWKAGKIKKVVVYDPPRGAAWYLAKEVEHGNTPEFCRTIQRKIRRWKRRRLKRSNSKQGGEI